IWPKRGWRTEEETFAARTRPAAAAIVKPLSVTKNGISAGMTPWLMSSKRCAAARSAIARRFMSSNPKGVMRLHRADRATVGDSAFVRATRRAPHEPDQPGRSAVGGGRGGRPRLLLGEGRGRVPLVQEMGPGLQLGLSPLQVVRRGDDEPRLERAGPPRAPRP